MTLSTLSRPVGSPFASLGGHAVHRTTALLQKALHASRRAALGREYGEERGIHRLSSPSAPDAPFGDGTTEGNFRSTREFCLLSSLSAGTPETPDYCHAGDERRCAPRLRGRRLRTELCRPKPIAGPDPRLQGAAATRRTRRCPVDRRGHRLDGDRARSSRGDGHSWTDGRREERRRRSAPNPRDRYTTFRRLSSSSTRSARSSGVDSLVRRSSSGLSGSS